MSRCRYSFILYIKGLNKKIIENLISSLTPDNVNLPSDLHIHIIEKDDEMEICIESENLLRIKNTVDDLIRCILPIINFLTKTPNIGLS